jgi:hypothetical protein
MHFFVHEGPVCLLIVTDNELHWTLWLSQYYSCRFSEFLGLNLSPNRLSWGFLCVLIQADKFWDTTPNWVTTTSFYIHSSSLIINHLTTEHQTLSYCKRRTLIFVELVWNCLQRWTNTMFRVLVCYAVIPRVLLWTRTMTEYTKNRKDKTVL